MELLISGFGVSPAPTFHLFATTHPSELRLSRLALFTVTHLDKLFIASAIQPRSILQILFCMFSFYRASRRLYAHDVFRVRL
jgi:hypothetical protein